MDLIDIMLANKLIEKKLPPTILNLRGTVSTTSQLPLTNNHKGDVWVVQSNNAEYVWMSDNASGSLSDYEDFGPVIDLSPYRTSADQDVIDSGKQAKVTASGILKGDGNGGVSAAVAGTDYGTYSKPVDGISSSDFASGVQTSLGKADTALQSSDLNPYRTSVEQDAIDAAKADTNGNYPEMTVGTSDRLSVRKHAIDTDPYNFRISGNSEIDNCNAEIDELIGATVNWNQLVQSTDISVTVPNGHKYVAYIGANKTVGISDGTALTVDGANGDKVFDITSMLGATIANYIYELEDETTGSGVAWFRKYFPKDNYNYSPGGLQSVCVMAHKMTGFNAYDNSVGTAKVLAGSEYEIIGSYTALALNGAAVIPVNGKFTPGVTGVLTVADGDETTCIHLVGDGSHDGTYSAYESNQYTLDGMERLRGLYILDENNELQAYGDVYSSDGHIERHFNMITRQTGAIGDTIELVGAKEDLDDIVTSVGHLADVGTIDGTTLTLSIAITNADILYEMATSTLESANPFDDRQKVNSLGYEEYIESNEGTGTITATVKIYNGERDIPDIVQFPVSYSDTHMMHYARVPDEYRHYFYPEKVPGKYFSHINAETYGPFKKHKDYNPDISLNSIFFVTGDTTITMVYDKNPVKGSYVYYFHRIMYHPDNKKLYVNFVGAPPYGKIMDDAGLVAASNNAGSKYTIGDELTAGNADFVKISDLFHNGNEAAIYYWTKKDVGLTPGEIWYMRPFMIYTDENNVQHTEYGEMETLIIDELKVRDVEIPVGHRTKYIFEPRMKLEDEANPPDVDGNYLMKREAGKNSYVKYTSPIPSAPVGDGTYTLKCMKSGTSVTYSWTADA